METSETQTLSILAHSIGSTSLGGAEVSHQGLVSITSFKWVSFVARLTATVKASLGVDADSIAAADLVAALVDVKAANEGVSIITLLTLADLARVALGDTLGIVSALTGNTDIHSSAGGAAIIGVATVAGVTLALVGNVVDTVTVGSTARAADGWQYGGHTQEVAVSNKTLFAETFVSVGIAGSIEATGGGITPLPALAAEAGQGLRTGVGSGAGLGHTGATREGVAKCSLGAGTGGALGGNDALGVEATDHTLTHGGTLAISILLEAHLAATPSSMVLGDTDGIVTAGDGGAGVDTGGLLAGKLARAVLIIGALHSGGCAHTSSQVGVTLGTLGTLTLVASILIDTAGAGSTGVAQALINVNTASDRITTISSLAETLGWVCGGAVSIDATLVSLTGALALAPIRGVSKEGWRTDTLARLHTLLIGSTVIIPGTLHLVGRAQTIVRITCCTQGTDAAEGANLVLAESSKATGSGTGRALVHISTASIRLGCEACWTRAIGYSPSNAHTLCSSSTLGLGLAALQDTVASAINVVGRGTATVLAIAACTGDEGITIVSSGTFTVKAARQILAEGILATNRIVGRGLGTLVNVSAQAAFSLESSLTQTFALTTEFSGWTRSAVAALLLLFTLTSNIGVSAEAAGTQTSVAARSVLTEGSLATGIAQTLIDVNAALETRAGGLVSLVTHAPGLSIEQGTQRVGRAEDVGTGTLTIGTLVRLGTHTDLVTAAESIAGTVLVPLASLDVDTFSGGGVGNSPSWTSTFVGSRQILTCATKATSRH